LWSGLEGCLERVKSGVWNTDSARLLDEDKLRGMASRAKYDEIWQDRMEASGLNNARDYARGEQIHEILEYHDGYRVLTVLDRQVLVQDAENPCVGHFPFQVYRPTPLQYQMVGIGWLEPLEHLQRELDTFRSQARDAATLALAPAVFFDDGAIEEDEITFGPNMATRVTNARPSDAVYFAPKPDLPASYFSLEQSIRADIDAVVGYNDNIRDDQAPVGTATEAQFEQAAAESRWRWVPIGPGELQGEFEIIPEGGSMAAANVAQDRADAQVYMGLVENPHIDGRKAILKALRLLGEKDPESWLRQEQPPVPPAAIEILKQMMPDQGQLIDFAVARAQQADPRLPDPGPDVGMVDRAMNGNGAAVTA
jgi:hypothetical protein